MNLFLYFCIPLVVTGQAISGIQDRRSQKQGNGRGYSLADVENPDTSETEAYSKYSYGDDVAYKNAALAQFVAGGQRTFQRNPLIEDSGAVGKPSIYQSANGDEEHPSFATANIYNSLKDKKTSGNQGNSNGQESTPKTTREVVQEPSPLAYDVHDGKSAALLAAQQPVAEVPVGQPQVGVVPIQDPRTGQVFYQKVILPSQHSQLAPAGVPLYHPGLVAAQHPGVLAAPPTKVLADPYHGVVAGPHGKLLADPHATKVVADPYQGVYAAPSTKLLADPYQGVLAAPPTKVSTDPYQGLVAAPHPHVKLLADPHAGLLKAHQNKVLADPYGIYAAQHGKLLIADPNQAVLGAPHTKVLTNPHQGIVADPHSKVLANPYLYQGVLPGQVLAKEAAPLAYDPSLVKVQAESPVLLKSSIDPAYQYQNALLKSPLLLKAPIQPLYQQPSLLKEAHQLTGLESPAYQQHVLKSTDPALLKSGYQYPTSYLAPLLKQHQSPLLLKQPEAPVLLKNGHPAVISDHPALLKTNGAPVLYNTVDPQVQVVKTAQAPVLKSNALLKTAPGVEAHIVPAIEEQVTFLENHLPAVPASLAKVPLALQHPQHVTRYVPSDVALVPKHPKAVLQSAVIKNPPVYTEKAVLKSAYSPAPLAYQYPLGQPVKAISKSPLATQYIQNSHIEPGLPSTILKSQKNLVKALISSDLRNGKAYGAPKGKTVLELVPSLSVGQVSSTLYANPLTGTYGPPQPFYDGRVYAKPQQVSHHHHQPSHHHHNHHLEAQYHHLQPQHQHYHHHHNPYHRRRRHHYRG